MTNRRQFIYGGFSLCATAAVSAQKLKNPDKIRVSYFPSFTSLMIMAAIGEGFDRAADLEIQLIQMDNGAAIETALVSGSVDAVINPPQLHFQMIEKGRSLKLFMGNLGNAFTIVVSNEAAMRLGGAKFPAFLNSLKGGKIGVTGRGTLHEVIWRSLLSQHGLNPERDVSFIGVGTGATAISAIEKGLVDAYLASEPITAILKSRKAGVPIFSLWEPESPPYLRDGFITNCWATTAEYAAKNPKIIKSLQIAIRRADKFIHAPENFEKTIEYALKIAPSTGRDVIKEALPSVLTTLTTELRRKDLLSVNKFLFDNKLVSQMLNLNDVILE